MPLTHPRQQSVPEHCFVSLYPSGERRLDLMELISSSIPSSSSRSMLEPALVSCCLSGSEANQNPQHLV